MIHFVTEEDSPRQRAIHELSRQSTHMSHQHAPPRRSQSARPQRYPHSPSHDRDENVGRTRCYGRSDTTAMNRANHVPPVDPFIHRVPPNTWRLAFPPTDRRQRRLLLGANEDTFAMRARLHGVSRSQALEWMFTVYGTRVGCLYRASWWSAAPWEACPGEMATAVARLALQECRDAYSVAQQTAVKALERYGMLRIHETDDTSGFWHKETSLVTSDGRHLDTISRDATFVGSSLYRDPSGVLYVGYRRSSSSFCCGCNRRWCHDCGQEGKLEPLAKITGQLASMQTQAVWEMLLVLQIVEVRRLSDDVAALICSFLRVPGTYNA